MKDSFRQSMAFLHGWAGLIPGWLLYAVFLTGSLTYYRQEITQWMRPELTGVTADPSAVPHALAWLGEHGQGATLWRIDLPTPRTPVTEVLWKGDGGFASQLLDPRTGGPLRVRETMGGDFLFYFHFDLNAPGSGGRWLVCFAAIIMLVALISGIVTHRRIFADFFTFRPRKGQRSWLDAHNVAGVAALPYHLLISFTGLVALMTMFMPWGIDKAFSGNVSAFRSALAEQTPITFPAGPGRRFGLMRCLRTRAAIGTAQRRGASLSSILGQLTPSRRSNGPTAIAFPMILPGGATGQTARSSTRMTTAGRPSPPINGSTAFTWRVSRARRCGFSFSHRVCSRPP